MLPVLALLSVFILIQYAAVSYKFLKTCVIFALSRELTVVAGSFEFTFVYPGVLRRVCGPNGTWITRPSLTTCAGRRDRTESMRFRSNMFIAMFGQSNQQIVQVCYYFTLL